MTTAYGHDDDRREEGMAQEDIKRDSKIRRRRYASIQSVTIVPSFMVPFIQYWFNWKSKGYLSSKIDTENYLHSIEDNMKTSCRHHYVFCR